MIIQLIHLSVKYLFNYFVSAEKKIDFLSASKKIVFVIYRGWGDMAGSRSTHLPHHAGLSFLNQYNHNIMNSNYDFSAVFFFVCVCVFFGLALSYEQDSESPLHKYINN